MNENIKETERQDPPEQSESSGQDRSGQEQPEPKKRSSFGLWIFAAAVFLFLITGISLYLSSPKSAGSGIDTRSITLTDAGFDTPITLQATCSEEDFNRFTEITKDTFVEYNKLFDQYNSYEGAQSLKDINEEAADHPVEISQPLAEVLNDSFKANQISSGFDISQGKLIGLWHDARESETPYLPDDADIQQALLHTGMSGIELNGTSLSFADDSISLDLGAIAKGYTAQIAAQRLKEAGMTDGFVNAGGNVVLIGNKSDGTPWKVGIQNPDTSDSLVIIETGQPEALVTSGDYQRYMTVDGKRYAHIIDPSTGYPAEYMRSVTVVDEDSAFADAMSTALFCMPLEQGMQLAKDQGFEAVWFLTEGTSSLKPDLSAGGFDIYISDGLKGSTKLSKAALSQNQPAA